MPVRKSTVLLTVLLLSLARPAWPAERMPMPPLGKVERGEYRARDVRTGADLWRVQWTVGQEIKDGRPVLRLHEEGKGTRESLAPLTWTVGMIIDLWGEAPRLSSRREARDETGQPVQIEDRDFDYARGAGRLVTTDLRTGDKESKNVRLNAQSIPPELLPAALRLLPSTKEQQMRFDLVTRGGFVLGIQVKLLGRERVEVPAGSFDCFKLELDPTGLVGLVADILLPRLFMWHTVAAPHFWVKYQGPEGGPGSREIVRELTRFETQ